MGPPQAPRPVAVQPTGLSGADFIRILRQRLVLVCVLWLLFTAIGVGITLLVMKYYPSFSAQALIRVQSINPVNVMNPLEPQRVEEQEVQRLLQDQALMVKSPQVLVAALSDPELRGTIWYKEAERKDKEKNEDPKDLLSDMISASPIRDSNYLLVKADWRIPRELPILVNTVVGKYLDLVNSQKKEGMRKNQEQLSKELNDAKTLYENKQQEIEAFRSNEEALGKAGDQTKEKVMTLSALLTELEVDSLGKKAQWEALQEANPESLPITPDLAHQLEADPKLLQLEQDLQRVEDGLSTISGRYGPNHRMVREATAARDKAADRLAEEKAQKILRYQSELIEQARRNFLEAQEQLVKVREQLAQAQAEQRDNEVKLFRYNSMVEEKEQLRQQYERLVEQHHLLRMALRQEKSVQIDLTSSAIEPRRRSNPKPEIWIPASVVLGLAASVGIALLLELTDKSVRTPRDVLRQAIPVLGTIPITDDDEIEIARVETASLDAPHSVVAEAFRNLRANLFFSAPAEQQGVLLVSSPSGGNGKTTVATNLAISIALSGRRVLLIDANFRRPGLPRIFPEMRSDGLSNLLIGQGRIDDMVVSSSVPGLDLLSSGPTPPNPAELLGSSYLRDLVVDARARYDQVIFDGPPILLVSDAMVLAGAVDGVLLVCQYRTTSRGALQRTQSQLEAISARIFGAVLNQVESRAGGYFRKTYREFYEYHETEEEVAAKQPRLDTGARADEIQPAAAAAAAAAVAEAPPGDQADFEAALPAETAEAILEMPPPPEEGADLAGMDLLEGSGVGGQPAADHGDPLSPAGGEWPGDDLPDHIDQVPGDPHLGGADEFRLDDDLPMGDDDPGPDGGRDKPPY
jgi:capsular exopolysaccharide synthesis family protein